ncbi:hypothetical protein GYMLUDRAFT_206518 [Collybiopsis luxurians FD-317 M1]|uniref:Amidohydrolase-related domain-containing protein n=1 Tax=Collybiopsis luxurians FD-317 M1 TaxID=944289 RepID=A0A0D0CI01_9AGAR|nr:hypothetical protein GYMLUDRAFT_206518 [Collybiopsis luxurians FD-317 M1]
MKEQSQHWTRRRSRLPFAAVLVILIASFLVSDPSSLSLWPNRQAYDPVSAFVNSEWQDNVYPFRSQTPWDISTNFSYPRLLEYDVQEGTWLRLDVHPSTGDIVFDMLGDLYCISFSDLEENSVPRARPILLGVPYDAEPRFSPNGRTLAFRSDAGLGIDNIWVMNWTSCVELDRRPLTQGDPLLAEALEAKEAEEELLFVKGVPETETRRRNRLMREGRLEAQRVTNETYRYVSSPRFHPSENKIIASKWYTGRVTIAAPEGWEYPLPDLSIEQKSESVSSGAGRRVLGRTLPRGMSLDNYEDYANLQIGPEQFIWAGDDKVIFAKNVVDEYVTSESKDIHKGVFAIFSRNLTTGKEETLVGAFPGSASRPELSRDGRSLAFVRHVGEHEVLVIKDLYSGSLYHLWQGLSHAFTMTSTISGSYPSFAFTPNDSAIIIWAKGQIYSVPLTKNEFGEKILSEEPKPIRFTAHIEKRLAETRRLKSELDLLGLETKNTQRIHALKELSVDETGSKAVFQAAGKSIVVQLFGDGGKGKAGIQAKPATVPVLSPSSPYYSPSFVPGTNHFVVHARWSDTAFTTLELADIDSDRAYELSGIPFGRYFAAAVSEGQLGDTWRQIAFVKSAGDAFTGHILATARPGIYVGEIHLPSGNEDVRDVPVRGLRFIPNSDVDPFDLALNLRFIRQNYVSSSSRFSLLVQQSSRAFIIPIDSEAEVEASSKVIVTGMMSSEITVAPSFRGGVGVSHVAFMERQHIYITSGSNLNPKEKLWAKPGNSTKGLMRLSVDGGHDLAWSKDGRRLSWLLGPVIHTLDVSLLSRCFDAAESDPDTFGISCTKDLIEKHVVYVEHATDIARLQLDSQKIRESSSSHGNTSARPVVVAIYNATILTMETGDESADLIERGVMLIQNGVILVLGSGEEIHIPVDAVAIDAMGGFVIPGFIDLHAHWSGYTSRYPAKSWEMQTFLAYGVTTLQNPSSHSVNTFAERSRLESGQFIGPRILTSGTVVFAGTWTGMYQEIVDEDEARAALNRIKAEAGPLALSYKNYQLPARASRQRLLKVAKDMEMLCFPEGGGNFDWNLAYIIDGMTTLEHSLPFAEIYEDVSNLFVTSGTGYTPTYIVNYGGPWGEEFVWANHDAPNDSKLRNFVPHNILERITESTARPKTSYVLFNASSYAAKMVHEGLKVHIGAHGEQPMGYNYHAEMFFTKSGGLTNYQVLRAATFDAAYTLGILPSVGTLTPGKLADFLIYNPDVDLLSGPIEDTVQLRNVVRGGRIWDSYTMTEVWPLTGRKQEMPPFNPS